MSSPNSALSRMVRPRKPARGASHALLEGMADGMFRGPAKHDHGIDLLVRDAVAERLPQARALAGMPEAAVPHLLNHQDGRAGLIVFDGALADALIEQQTLGRVSAAPRVERAVTAIDAALSTGFATSVAKKFDELISERENTPSLAGFQCGRPQIDRLALSLALEASHYDVLRVTLDLGPGLKTGLVQLFMPAEVDPSGDLISRAPNSDMVALIRDVALPLEVQLPKVSISLKTLIALKQDAQITLAPDALTEASLQDRKGYVVARGRLGQLKGRRAIRIEAADAMIVPEPAQLETELDGIGSGPAMAEPLDMDAMAGLGVETMPGEVPVMPQEALGSVASDLGGIEGEGFASAMEDAELGLKTQ